MNELVQDLLEWYCPMSGREVGMSYADISEKQIKSKNKNPVPVKPIRYRASVYRDLRVFVYKAFTYFPDIKIDTY